MTPPVAPQCPDESEYEVPSRDPSLGVLKSGFVRLLLYPMLKLLAKPKSVETPAAAAAVVVATAKEE